MFFDPDAAIQVKLGDHVQGGSTVLAVLRPELNRQPSGPKRANGRPARGRANPPPSRFRPSPADACAKACTFCLRCSPPPTSPSVFMQFCRPRTARVAEPWHFDFAAKAIGFAVLFDGLDGLIARTDRHRAAISARNSIRSPTSSPSASLPRCSPGCGASTMLPAHAGSSALTVKLTQLGIDCLLSPS